MILRLGRIRGLLVTILIALTLATGAHGSAQLASGAPAAQVPNAADTRSIAFGPYVQNVGKDNATICWATVTGEVTVTPTVDYGVSSVREYQTHSVVLRNLQPGTTYTYRVPGDTGDASRCTFRTVPEGEHPFSFIVCGDTQLRDNPSLPRLAQRVIADKPDLVINTGDVVQDGWSLADWENFLRVDRDLMRSTPYYAALGNHDNDSPLYFDFFALPGNERYYSFNRGAAHFVVLDSNGPRIPETNQAMSREQHNRLERDMGRDHWQRQLDWLRQDLEGAKDAKYVFVFFHHPLYTMKADRVEGAKARRAVFGSVFQENHVTAVFNGHDHHYHRAVAGGVQFVVAGGAGFVGRPLDAPPLPESVKYEAVTTFVQVEVGTDRARVRVTALDGHPVDDFELLPRTAGAR